MKKINISLFSLLTLLLVQPLMAYDSADDQEQYVTYHYSVKDGLSQNTVMAILQDRDGYMWFGTWDGLNKFDGYKFTTYKSHPEDSTQMRNNRVDFIYEDANGYIWFQTYDGYIFRFDKRREKFYATGCQAPTLLQQKYNQYFTESCPGEIWMVVNNGIAHIVSEEEPQTDVYKTGYDAHFIVCDNAGNVWYDASDGVHQWYHGEENIVLKSGLGTIRQKYTAAFSTTQSLWLGSDNGDVWRYSLQDGNVEHISIGNGATINSILRIDENAMLFATSSEGFYIYDKRDGKLQQYSSKDNRQIRSDNFHTARTDSRGIVWLENDEYGVLRYRHSDRSVKHFSPEVDRRYARQLRQNMILIEQDNTLWINPNGGGFSRYNYDQDILESPLTGLTNMIHTAYLDSDGFLWISTYDKGVDRVEYIHRHFILHDMHENGHSSGEVRAMLELSNGDVMIATKDGNVRRRDAKTLKVSKLPITDLVYCLYEDSKKVLWLGTRGKGLIRYENGKIERFQHTADPYSLSCNEIYSIVEDTTKGHLLIGTYGGGVNVFDGKKFIHSGNEWSQYPIDQCSKVRDLLLVGDSILFVATTGGLLQTDSRGNTAYTPYYDVHCLYKDHSENIWLGTFGGGLNRIEHSATATAPAQLKAFTTREGLLSDIVLAINEDENGRLWFTSETAITRYDPTVEIFQHFTPFPIAGNNYFTEANSMRLSSGKMVFGYTDGYCVFSPDRILRSDHVPPLVLTGFQLFNTDVAIGDDDSPLKESIASTDKITLKHNQSVFSIEYAALDFAGADKIGYAFLLEGFENNWNYVGNQRKATYTNLPRGTYHFKVCSTNDEGVWVDNTRELTIEVLPSFWQTGWAILVYILFAAIIIGISYVLFRRYNNLQQQMKVEQQVSDIKLRFFTNISHELRTPLTLISGPVDNILKTEKISQSVRTQLEIVRSNANRMLRLINGILDFRKIQNDKMRLKIQQTHFATLVQETCSNFNKEAYDKHIAFHIENRSPEQLVWLDREKTDMILYNLLSNAFKFTPAGKSITVIVEDKDEFVLLRVKDEGIGIPKDKRSVLFERFSSHNELESLTGKSGSGIGLNLVKELVDLHHGYIEVESEPGNGSVFTVMFRKGSEHFGNEVDFVIDDKGTEAIPEVKSSKKVDQILEARIVRNMLIVEDNDDMRLFLTNIFASSFNITTAADGMEGVDKAIVTLPDIIISDLMMPNMDGIQLLDELKKKETTSHIPIILLTAKETVESRLEAMQHEADDYITKPFSPEYVKARVDNILSTRAKLQDRYRQNVLNLKPMDVEKTSPDEIFLSKVMAFMEKNMDNNELVVDDMVSAMALGRTVFFNRLKNLTGLSPVEFIREVRIKRAAQLLQLGTYNITEVTYMVGMNDSRYFSKCFKAVYGMTPTEYKRSIGQ